ncbi:MAG TPA: carbon storage regulator CsrA [Bacteroidota bacterium]|nr:carbon storage regulator CsrA [Bacteroidota bacterium]
MLVLTRKFDESIMIGDSVLVKVIAIQDGQVKVGIEAPKDVRILRKEIFEEIHRSNSQAAKASKGAAMQAAKILQKKASPGNQGR